ncbi:DedA family protein [Nocardioides sp. HDW12B]|nr:DedA family protein [Nocardioides sp. HDW12B]
MEKLGGPGAGIAIAAENLFPPIPSEIILPLAGFTASQGSFTIAEAIFWTTAGSVVGALMMYALGAALGRRRMYAVWERLPLVKVSDLEKCEDWFARHGTKAVFFGRMVPIFRSLISVPAGVERMPIPVFLVLTTLGSLIWNSVFVLAGYQLGEQWERVDQYASTFQKVVIAAVVLFVCWWVLQRVRSIRASRRAVDS